MKVWNHIADMVRGIDGISVRENEPMARHTTLMIGGPVDLFVTFETPDALQAVMGLLDRLGCPWFVSGAGSNLLVMDAGIEGAVLVPGSGMSWFNLPADGRPEILAGSGLNVGTLLAAVSRAGFAGLEYLTGIPGTVGGAVAMNAGTRYGYVNDSLISVEVVSAAARREIRAADLGLGYRTSSIPSDSVVVSAVFRLVRGPSAEGQEVARTLSELRRNNHPPASGTAGSFFRNPDPAANLFAGQLIEECGLKGFSVGGAIVSPKHANFLMNAGGSTATDLLSLATAVRDKVLETKGVRLNREVRLIGRGSEEWQALLP